MVDEIKNEKYIVMSRADFENWQSASNHWWGHEIRPTLTPQATIEPPPLPMVLEDAVVIRRRDIFAGPGLYAYSHAIQTAIDLMDIAGNWEPDERESLEALRDFFADQAQLAVDSPNKHLPD